MAVEKTARSRWLRILLVIAILGALGIGIFSVMLRNWTTMRSFGAEQAQVEIQQILERMPDARPYFSLREDGTLHQDATLQTEDAEDVASLSVVLWNPGKKRWLHTDFPYWFVRLKMRNGLPLGPLRAALEQDWSQLSLDMTLGNLEDRGPGLILHQVAEDGREVLIWNAPADPE